MKILLVVASILAGVSSIASPAGRVLNLSYADLDKNGVFKGSLAEGLYSAIPGKKTNIDMGDESADLKSVELTCYSFTGFHGFQCRATVGKQELLAKDSDAEKIYDGMTSMRKLEAKGSEFEASTKTSRVDCYSFLNHSNEVQCLITKYESTK